MFSQATTDTAFSRTTAMTDEDTSILAASKNYQTLSSDLGTRLYALFTEYPHLNYFGRNYYPLENDPEDSDTYLAADILVRKKEDKATKYDVLGNLELGSGSEGHVSVIDATFKLDHEAGTALVKFGDYVVKTSKSNLSGKKTHLAKLQHEQTYTRLVTPESKMKEPVLFNSRGRSHGFLVMKEHIGKDLDDLIAEHYTSASESNTPPFKLTTRGILTLILNLAEVIVDMHVAKNVIHRDLKPANLWIYPDLSTKILDLSFAKRRIEKDQNICGSIAYLDPSVSAALLSHQFMKYENSAMEEDGKVLHHKSWPVKRSISIDRNTEAVLDLMTALSHDNLQDLDFVKHGDRTKTVPYNNWPEEEKYRIFTEKSEAWIFGLMIGEILNIVSPIRRKKGESEMESAHKRNAALRLDSNKVHLADITPREIDLLIELANKLLNPVPQRRPTLEELLPTLKELLLPILSRLSEQPLYTGTFPARERASREVKLAALNNLLLFKPKSEDSDSSYASHSDLDHDHTDEDPFERSDGFEQSAKESSSASDGSFVRETPSTSSASGEYTSDNSLDDTLEHLDRQCAQYEAKNKQQGQAARTPRPGRGSFHN